MSEFTACGRVTPPCKCGGRAYLFYDGGAFWYVECAECGIKVEGDTMTEALDNWERKVSNERATGQ